MSAGVSGNAVNLLSVFTTTVGILLTGVGLVSMAVGSVVACGCVTGVTVAETVFFSSSLSLVGKDLVDSVGFTAISVSGTGAVVSVGFLSVFTFSAVTFGGCCLLVFEVDCSFCCLATEILKQSRRISKISFNSMISRF